MTDNTPAYAVARLRDIRLGPEIEQYLERIDATLAPYDGRFLIHGGQRTVLEGNWGEDLIVIAFPDRARAEAWYHSPAYQRILPLRTGNAAGDAIVIDGVGPGHRGPDALRRPGHPV